ncbi:MAG: endonuclease III [Acidobacteriota bacterium]
MTAARGGPSKKQRKEQARVGELLRLLADEYPDATCALHHRNAYQLLVATILSAQCTDERVNKVTPALFETYPSAPALAEAEEVELQEIIRSTGFFRNKSKSLLGSARGLAANFGGEVPTTMEELLTLPGVARKTANVVLGTAYGIAEGIVVDTHVSRISRRLGLTREKAPPKIEKDLMAQLPRNQWIDFSHRIIHHGRRICKARKPKCPECVLADLCPYYLDPTSV